MRAGLIDWLHIFCSIAHEAEANLKDNDEINLFLRVGKRRLNIAIAMASTAEH
jgi:hypothetical protein